MFFSAGLVMLAGSALLPLPGKATEADEVAALDGCYVHEPGPPRECGRHCDLAWFIDLFAGPLKQYNFLTPCDFDGNCRVDLRDVQHFQNCYPDGAW